MEQVMTFDLAEGELRITRVSQEVAWEDGPDESWGHTDAEGHRHKFSPELTGGQVWRKGKRRKDRPTHYPTLRLVIDFRYRCNCTGDPHWVENSHYECRVCGRRVEPGHGPGSALVPTMVTYELGGQLISQDRAVELLSQWQAVKDAAEADAEALKVTGRLGYPAAFAGPA